MTREQYAALTEEQREILNANRREKYKALTKEQKRARAGYRPYALLSDEQKKNKRRRNREWMRAWNREHPEEGRERSLFNYRKHKAKRIAKIAEWKARNRDRVTASNKRSEARLKRWLKKQPYWNHRYATEVQHRLKRLLQARLHQALCASRARRSGKTVELLGCTLRQLKVHIESKFLSGMSWDNRSKWHIDHIRPCASFDLTDPGQQRLCFHYTNLQPLWAGDNHRKGARLLSA